MRFPLIVGQRLKVEVEVLGTGKSILLGSIGLLNQSANPKCLLRTVFLGLH